MEVSLEDAFKATSEDQNFAIGSKCRISYSDLTKRTVILHKIVINCLKPKAASKTNLSKSEIKFIWAILNRKSFSLPYIIIFHMYRTLQKDKGQLPYDALIFRIFIFLNITIPDDLYKTFVSCMFVGEKMLTKMKHFDDKKERASTTRGKDVRQSEPKSVGKKNDEDKGKEKEQKESKLSLQAHSRCTGRKEEFFSEMKLIK